MITSNIFTEEEFELEVTAAAYVQVEINMEISAMGQTMEESTELTIPAIEIDGTWYIDVVEFGLSDFSPF